MDLAFVLAFVLWFDAKVSAKWLEKPMNLLGLAFSGLIGVLWSVWLQQDAANIAVYLPRNLSGWEFTGFADCRLRAGMDLQEWWR